MRRPKTQRNNEPGPGSISTTESVPALAVPYFRRDDASAATTMSAATLSLPYLPFFFFSFFLSFSSVPYGTVHVIHITIFRLYMYYDFELVPI